jgi:hypothetical protein
MEKQLINILLKQLKHGTLKVTFWDGETKTYGRGQPKARLFD